MIRKRSRQMASIAQIRGARGLLGWSQSQLATAAGLSEPTIKRFETGRGANVSDAAAHKMHAALEAAGVEFIAENGGGAGVRLRKAAPAAIPAEELNASNDE
jgi:transcriptional regulator with XRE-family HTH domain